MIISTLRSSENTSGQLDSEFVELFDIMAAILYLTTSMVVCWLCIKWIAIVLFLAPFQNTLIGKDDIIIWSTFLNVLSINVQ